MNEELMALLAQLFGTGAGNRLPPRFGPSQRAGASVFGPGGGKGARFGGRTGSTTFGTGGGTDPFLRLLNILNSQTSASGNFSTDALGVGGGFAPIVPDDNTVFDPSAFFSIFGTGGGPGGAAGSDPDSGASTSVFGTGGGRSGGRDKIFAEDDRFDDPSKFAGGRR